MLTITTLNMNMCIYFSVIPFNPSHYAGIVNNNSMTIRADSDQ